MPAPTFSPRLAGNAPNQISSWEQYQGELQRVLDVTWNGKADVSAATPSFRSRADAVAAALALPAAITQIIVQEGTATVTRLRTAFADDPLYATGSRWGVVQRQDGRSIANRLTETEAALSNKIDAGIASGAVVGSWNPSSGAFPTQRPGGSPILRGDTWLVSGSGTVGGQAFNQGDYLQAAVAGGGAQFQGAWTFAAIGTILKYRNDVTDMTARVPPAYRTRAEAQAAPISDAVQFIEVNGHKYVKTAGATALVTAGGAFAPLGDIKFDHLGLNLTENGNNSAAIAAMLAYIGPSDVMTIPKGTYGAEAMPPAYGVGPGTTLYHLRSGSLSDPSTDIRPMIRMEKVASPLDTDGIAQLMALHMRVVSGTKGGAALTVEADSMESSGGAAIPIHMRGKTGSATASGWGGWAYMDVQGARPLRAIGFEVNLRVNLADNPIWSADGKARDIDGFVVSLADSGTNNKANSAFRIAKSLPHTDDKGFLTGIQLASRALLPSDDDLNGEFMMVNGVDQNIQRYGGIRFGHGTRNRFHYAFRTNEADFNNNVAFWLGADHRIRWGNAISSGPYLTMSASVSRFQFVGAPIEVSSGLSSAIYLDGRKVLGVQQSAIADALNAEQKLALVLSALRAHGIIAA